MTEQFENANRVLSFYNVRYKDYSFEREAAMPDIFITDPCSQYLCHVPHENPKLWKQANKIGSGVGRQCILEKKKGREAKKKDF